MRSASAWVGALGVSERAADHCDTGCAQAQKDAAAAKFRVADVSLGVSVVALGVAAWMYFTRPEAKRATAFLGVRF